MVPVAGEPYRWSAMVQAVADSRRYSWPGRPAGPRRSPGPAGSRTRPPAALGGPDDPVGLGGDEGLVVQGEEQEGLHKLGLDGGGPDGEQGLAGEDRGALGHRPDVPGEAEGAQEVQELLAEAALAPEIDQVLLVKAQLLDVLHHLGQAGGDGEAPLVGDRAVEHIEVADPVLQTGLEIAVGHGQLVEVAQHGQVGLCFHGKNPLFQGISPFHSASYYTLCRGKRQGPVEIVPFQPGKRRWNRVGSAKGFGRIHRNGT